MMRVMVTGATGLLGQDVMRTLQQQGITSLGLSREDVDLTDENAVMQVIMDWKPDAIVHCAAYTAVDQAENDQSRCIAVNSMGTLHVARAARKVGAKLLYPSTDYVFDGQGDGPYSVNDRPCPLNVYGLSKLQGEEAIRGVMSRYFILRTSWMFGAGGNNFVRTMLSLGHSKSQIQVVNDQIGAPTYSVDLAQLIVHMIATDRYGVYHATNEGCCSFAEFASAILHASGSKCRVIPVPSAAYPMVARRPLNSRLSKDSLDQAGFARLPIWEDALARFLSEIQGHS